MNDCDNRLLSLASRSGHACNPGWAVRRPASARTRGALVASRPEGEKVCGALPAQTRWRSIQVKARAAQVPGTVVTLSTRRRHAWARSWLAALAAAALLAALATGTATAGAGPAGADDATVITDWNTIAVTTLVGDTTKQGTETILYMGFVQAAVYDAVVGVEGRYEPYRFHAHAPRGTSAQAAAVAAAHRVLVIYVPSVQAISEPVNLGETGQLGNC